MLRFLPMLRPLFGLSAILWLLAAGCGRPSAPAPEARAIPVVGVTEVETREGRVWLKGTNVLFTGVMRETYTNGTVKAEATVRDGRLEGPTRGFYASGRLQVEEHFVGGVSDGVRRRFHEDGTPKSAEEISQGRLHGKSERFHPNGKLAERGTYREGQPDGLAESWDAAGQPVARVRFEQGKVVEQTFLNGAVAPRIAAGNPQP